jgi:chaperone BCS1
MIRALATELRMPIVLLTAFTRSLESDVAQWAKSIIVLEDVDELLLADDKSDDDGAGGAGGEKKVSESKIHVLLQVLDGICNPHGSIFLLTSNHMDRLDPRLLRPGRIDEVFEFAKPSAKHYTEMARKHYPGSSDTEVRKFSEEAARVGSMSTVQVIVSSSADIVGASESLKVKTK